jgi:hypothetical protein
MQGVCRYMLRNVHHRRSVSCCRVANAAALSELTVFAQIRTCALWSSVVLLPKPTNRSPINEQSIALPFMALDGYEHVRALQQRLTVRINPALALLGLLPTRYRTGTAHAQAALEEIQQQVEALQVPLRFAPIRLAVAAADAPAHGMMLADFAPASAIAQEYRRVTEQILHFLEGQR